MATPVPLLSNLVLPGSGYPALSAIAAPVLPFAEDLVLLRTYGYSLDVSRYGYIEGHPLLGVVGSPEILADRAILTRDNCFESDFVPPPDYTVISIAKPFLNTEGTTQNSFLVSNYGNPSAGVFVGDSIMFTMNGGVPVYQNQVQRTPTATGVSGTIDISGLDVTQWHMFASVFGATSSNVAVGRGGLVTWGTTQIAGAHEPDQPRPLRIGGLYLWPGTQIGVNGQVEKALTAIYSRKLEEPEVESVYQALSTAWGPLAGLTGL